MEEMNKNFERLKAIDEAAYEDLKKRGVEHWCMAYFNTDCKVRNYILEIKLVYSLTVTKP